MPSPLAEGDPTTVGPYTLEACLGIGAMGRVFVARDILGQKVALKIIHAGLIGDPRIRARFRREVAAAKAVPEFCTAAVLDADVDGDMPYLVSEYISGPSLADMVAMSGPLADGEIESLAIAMAAALTKIHSCGVVHRDLKPANVLLGPTGPRVIDFGLAVFNEASAIISRSGDVIGTPAYMAPEQLASKARVDSKADIFAWASVLYFASTGDAPFGTSAADLYRRLQTEKPDMNCLPVSLRAVSGMAFEKDPRNRPTAADLLVRIIELNPDVLVSGTQSSLRQARTRPLTLSELIAEARDSLEGEKFRLALSYAERAIQIDPECANAHYVYGVAKRHLGDITTGLDSLRLAWEIDTDNGEISRAFALALCEEEGSPASVNLAFKACPGEQSVREAYARNLSRDPTRLRDAFNVDPSSPAIRDELLYWLVGQGDDEIVEAYGIAVSSGSELSDFLAMLTSEFQLRVALRLVPDSETIRKRLSRILRESGREMDAFRIGLLDAEERSVLATSLLHSRPSSLPLAYEVEPDDKKVQEAYLEFLSHEDNLDPELVVRILSDASEERRAELIEYFSSHLLKNSEITAIAVVLESIPDNSQLRRRLLAKFQARGVSGIRAAHDLGLISTNGATEQLLRIGSLESVDVAFGMRPTAVGIRDAFLGLYERSAQVDPSVIRRLSDVLEGADRETKVALLRALRTRHSSLLAGLCSFRPSDNDVVVEYAELLSESKVLAQMRKAYELRPSEPRFKLRLALALIGGDDHSVREAFQLQPAQEEIRAAYSRLLGRYGCTDVLRDDDQRAQPELIVEATARALLCTGFLCDIVEACQLAPQLETHQVALADALLADGRWVDGAAVGETIRSLELRAKFNTMIADYAIASSLEEMLIAFKCSASDPSCRKKLVRALLSSDSSLYERIRIFQDWRPRLGSDELAVADAMVVRIVRKGMGRLGPSNSDEHRAARLKAINVALDVVTTPRERLALQMMANEALKGRIDNIAWLGNAVVVLLIVWLTAALTNSSLGVVRGVVTGAILVGIALICHLYVMPSSIRRRRALRIKKH